MVEMWLEVLFGLVVCVVNFKVSDEISTVTEKKLLKIDRNLDRLIKSNTTAIVELMKSRNKNIFSVLGYFFK